ncbi:hypothetical protein D3260_12895 [Salinisphaera sp. Q1T1-3]|nr:hypothetical protein D3260_12895 [Salinisphaera sp. Q1T1-3]
MIAPAPINGPPLWHGCRQPSVGGHPPMYRHGRRIVETPTRLVPISRHASAARYDGYRAVAGATAV